MQRVPTGYSVKEEQTGGQGGEGGEKGEGGREGTRGRGLEGRGSI
jgi:hypothetical protein